MGDKYKRASVGDPISGIPADTYNDLLDLLKRSDHRKSAPQAEVNTLVGVEILIKNVSGSDLADLSIVGVVPAVTKTLVGPYKNNTYFFGRAVRESQSPSEAGPFAILLRSAIQNEIVPAFLPGGMFAKVNLSSTTDEYAVAATSDYASLAGKPVNEAGSSAYPALILNRALPTDMQLDGGIDDSVTTMTVDANTDWPDPPYVVQIDSEQILVDARSGTDNVTQSSLTRGYNGTTPASHADNAPVSFVSGIVWCLIQLSPYPPDATYTQRGLVSMTTQGFAGLKSFKDGVVVLNNDDNEGVTLLSGPDDSAGGTGLVTAVGSLFSLLGGVAVSGSDNDDGGTGSIFVCADQYVYVTVHGTNNGDVTSVTNGGYAVIMDDGLGTIAQGQTSLQAGLQFVGGIYVSGDFYPWVSAPSTSGDTGTAGQIAYDSSYIYVCTATDTWVRAALSSW